MLVVVRSREGLGGHQRAAVLLSWQAVQRKPVGRLQWSTANRSSSAWPPRQARNVSPIGCSFYRSWRPSTGSVLWLPASSTSPTSTKPELKTCFPIGSRLPELHMASRTDASPFWHVSCSVPARPIIGMDVYGIEWNKQDHTLRAVIPGDRALHATWESLAILVALDTCIVHLQGKCAADNQTDATAALFNMKRLSGKTAHDITIAPGAHEFRVPGPQPIVTRSSSQWQTHRDIAVFAQSTVALLLLGVAEGDQHNRVVRCSSTQRHPAGRVSPGGKAPSADLGSALLRGQPNSKGKEGDSSVHQFAQHRRSQHSRTLPCRQFQALQCRVLGHHVWSLSRALLRGWDQFRGLELQSRPRWSPPPRRGTSPILQQLRTASKVLWTKFLEGKTVPSACASSAFLWETWCAFHFACVAGHTQEVRSHSKEAQPHP